MEMGKRFSQEVKEGKRCWKKKILAVASSLVLLLKPHFIHLNLYCCYLHHLYLLFHDIDHILLWIVIPTH